MEAIGGFAKFIVGATMMAFFGIIARYTDVTKLIKKHLTGVTFGILLFAMGAVLLFWWAENLPLPDSDTYLPAKEQLETQILQEEMNVYH